MPSVRIHVRGPSMFCPDCGRCLVQVHDDGTWDLAGQATILLGHDPIDVERIDEEISGYVSDAYCLLWKCRMKRIVKDAVTG